MTQNTQVIQNPIKYTNGCVPQYASTTTLSVSAGAKRDSNNVTDMVLSTAVTINSAVNGINGLDTGTIAASTLYYIYIISDSASTDGTTNPAGAVISISATTPTLPAGYDSYALNGYWFTDGSSHFVLGYVTASTGGSHTFYYDAPVSVLSGGSSATAAAVSLATAVPPVAYTPVWMSVSFTPATGGDSVSFRPTGSSATASYTVSSVVAAKAQLVTQRLLSNVAAGAAKVDYINSAASGATTLLVQGYEYTV